MVKQAGGDEELAKKIAIDNVMKNDESQIQTDGSEESSAGGESGGSAAPKKKKSAPKKKKKEEPEDIFDELDML